MVAGFLDIHDSDYLSRVTYSFSSFATPFVLGTTLPIRCSPEDVATLDWTFLEVAGLTQQLEVCRII